MKNFQPDIGRGGVEWKIVRIGEVSAHIYYMDTLYVCESDTLYSHFNGVSCIMDLFSEFNSRSL